MTVLTWVLDALGGLCTIVGILTMLEIAPAFFSAEETIGPVISTTAFWWGLAVILFLAAIAVAVGRQREE